MAQAVYDMPTLTPWQQQQLAILGISYWVEHRLPLVKSPSPPLLWRQGMGGQAGDLQGDAPAINPDFQLAHEQHRVPAAGQPNPPMLPDATGASKGSQPLDQAVTLVEASVTAGQHPPREQLPIPGQGNVAASTHRPSSQPEIKSGLEVSGVDGEVGTIRSAASPLAFRLHAVEINQWIVLLNAADLHAPAQATLWQNLLRAFHQPVVSHFTWPLSDGQRWQRTMGARAALNGFLYKLGGDKRIGLMGYLPDEACPERLERLPNLVELIEQPLKKRLLWNLLQAR